MYDLIVYGKGGRTVVSFGDDLQQAVLVGKLAEVTSGATLKFQVWRNFERVAGWWHRDNPTPWASLENREYFI
jgi:hypothetical protein